MNVNWSDGDEEKEEDKEISTLTYSEVSKWASGVCDQCHNRYTGVPVIDGKPQCPNCDKP